MTFIKNVFKDIVTLRLPVTAGALVATIAALVEPFGLDIASGTAKITGALVAVGVIAEYIKSRA